MAKVSFEGIGEVLATFYAETGVKAGQVVKLSGDSKVAPCTAGERFCGVAASVRDGCAAVWLGGVVQVKCDDSDVTPGYVKLTADGDGGVVAADVGDNGSERLVLSVDDGVCAVLL